MGNMMTSLLAMLQQGEDKSLSREYLCSILGVDDRTLRDVVYQARCAGHNILSNSNNNGYFLPDDGFAGIQQTQEFIAQQESRVKSIRSGLTGAIQYVLQARANS